MMPDEKPWGYMVLVSRLNSVGQEVPEKCIGPFATKQFAMDHLRANPYDMTVYVYTVVPMELPNTVIGI